MFIFSIFPFPVSSGAVEGNVVRVVNKCIQKTPEHRNPPKKDQKQPAVDQG
jgi:hypothetical protein